MITFAIIIFLLQVGILVAINNLNRKADNIMATLDERLAGIESKLDEASTEILADIAALKGEGLSAEGQATLARLETKAQALADIVPNTPAETPAA